MDVCAVCEFWGPLGALPWVVLCCLLSRLLVYSAGSGVNRVQVVLSGFNKRLFCPGKNFM